MPARTSTRAPRTSTTSTKSTRTASARQSAHAVEIPDEGPATSLRTQVAQIFGDAQKTTTTQRKLVVNLRKIQEACCFEAPQTGKKGKNAMMDAHEDFDQDDFNTEIVRCVLRVLGVKKSESVGDRLVRFLGLFLKHASEKDAAMYAAEAEEDATPEHERPTNRLISQVLTTIIGFLTAKDKTIRFRATQTIAHIMNSLETIDNDMFDLLRLGLMKRLRDKEPSVRVQAILCLGRLSNSDDDEQEDEDSDDDAAGSILSKLVEVMIHDPSAEVRRAVLNNLPLLPSTLTYMFERARDMDPAARRAVYKTILPKLGDFRHMSLVQREKLIRWGLRDRDDMVRKHAARLFSQRWLENCAASRDNRPEEEKIPGEVVPPNLEALCELLERIEVTRSGEEDGMAHEAMRELWDGRPDYREYITFDHEFWNNLDAQKAFIVRTLNDYCQSVQDDRLQDTLEDKMPEVTAFAYIIQRELNKLMEVVDTAAVLDEDHPDAEEAQDDVEEGDFIVQQLLHIALSLDYSDEVGRRQMYNIMREAMAKAQLPEECTKLAIEVLRATCGTRGESEFCALIVEAIAEVRDSLLDGDEDTGMEAGSDVDGSVHSAASDVQENAAFIRPAKRAKTGKELDPEEEEEQRIRETMVYSKCLHIAQCALQNVHRDLETDNSLTSILNTLIIPAVQSHESMIRERGVICLGLAALLSKDLALKNLELFFHCFTKGHDALKEIVIQVLTDAIITHPQLLAPPAVDPNASSEDLEPKSNLLVRPITKLLVKAFNSDNKRISLVACTAASKLLLMGILPPAPTADILKSFTLTYFDPETGTNLALRQALSYFLPVFCHSKLKNVGLMAQVAVPVLSKLLLMRDESVEEEADEMVGWPVVTAHLAEWTDGRKVVGATSLGLDGKFHNVPDAQDAHVHLAIAVLERALSNTCSKDERKPLLMLLAKLHVVPAEAGANTHDLHALHGLVAEAVEAKLGTDAAQRNALAKLEAALEKVVGDLDRGDEEGAESDATVTPGRAAETSVEPEPEAEADGKVQRSVSRETETETDAETDAGSVRQDVGVGVDADGDVEMEDDDTMFAGMQGEGTRMPLELDEEEDDEEEDDDDDEEENTVVSVKRERMRGMAITEDDIVEDLLESDMSD
ncbi:ARM repeat-containing protein [Dothidotthia symphoricarpi CBS 119687]|uniref:ARM repeat-containing protein n=1 Tax=Dothidotthia symphoricarpi CBS 119687 TaxID=1392245 RepID=A0A6A6A2A7_9PLEO|nr:ARM repeat-containing protein [Dothidotthia symphoricarpi CBS 119687]KAF2125313.1 ARM repeat-containing protein [Dothidotthia symphoricarpi CBS 119687]